MRDKPNREAVNRALTHHTLRGVLRDWSPPGGTHPGRYRVHLFQGREPLDLSLREAWALAQGLAAAHLHAEHNSPRAGQRGA